MRTLLKPATFILNSLTYAFKFILVGVLILIPLSVTMYYLVIELNEGYDFAYDERTGVEYNLGIHAFMAEMNGHRRLLSSGDANSSQAAQKAVEQKINEMDRVNEKLGEQLQASEDWAALKAHWTQLKDSQANLTPEQASQQYSSLMNESASLITHVGDTSKLILDPDLDSYYLMDATIIRLPLLAKQIGDLRDQGKQLSKQSTFPREQLTELIRQAAAIEIGTKGIEDGYAIIVEQNPSLKAELDQPVQQFLKSMESFQTALHEGYIGYDKVNADYTPFTEAAQSAVLATHALYVADAGQLDGLIVKRQDHYAQVKRFVISFVAVLALIVCYMFAGFYSSIMRAIRSLLDSTEEVAKGHLNTRMPIITKDEMRTTAISFNRMVTEMKALISASSLNADQAASTSSRLADIARHSSEANTQLAASIQETAQGAQFQLRSTEDSAKAITEMSVGIGRIAETTSSVLNESIDSAEQAEEGKLALDRVVNQMDAIQQSVNGTALSIEQLNGFAQQVGKMAELIKGLAYKSNILALNASIEAVRAGEHGRGFVVVANETRKLAEMSGASADGISEVLDQILTASEHSLRAMNEMRHEVQLGSQIVQEAGHSFQAILASTRNIAGHMQEISAAAEQMTASSEQVSATIQQISDIAKGSSEQVRQMSDMSSSNAIDMKELSAQADSLKLLSSSLQEQIKKFTS